VLESQFWSSRRFWFSLFLSVAVLCFRLDFSFESRKFLVDIGRHILMGESCCGSLLMCWSTDSLRICQRFDCFVNYNRFGSNNNRLLNYDDRFSRDNCMFHNMSSWSMMDNSWLCNNYNRCSALNSISGSSGRNRRSDNCSSWSIFSSWFKYMSRNLILGDDLLRLECWELLSDILRYVFVGELLGHSCS